MSDPQGSYLKAVHAVAKMLAVNDYDSWTDPCLPLPRRKGDVKDFQADYLRYATRVVDAVWRLAVEPARTDRSVVPGPEFDAAVAAVVRVRELCDRVQAEGRNLDVWPPDAAPLTVRDLRQALGEAPRVWALPTEPGPEVAAGGSG